MRGAVLVVCALVLGAGLVAFHVREGGTDFGPSVASDPCAVRTGGAIAPRIDPLAQQIVLVGLDEAACELGVSRERLLLTLADPGDRRALARRAGTDDRGLALSLRAALRRAVDRLDRARALPLVSELEPEILDQLDLPGTVRSAIELVPDETVDDLLPTAGVLRRSIDQIDVEDVLAGLRDPATLEPALRDAVEQGARAEVERQLLDRLPDGLDDLLSG